MRALLLTTLLLATALSGCAADDAAMPVTDTQEPVRTSTLPGVNASATDATAWIGEFATGPGSVAAFTFTVPNATLEYFDEEHLGIELFPILPKGAALNSGYIQILFDGESIYHGLMEPISFRFRGSPPSLASTYTLPIYDGATWAFLDPVMAGSEVTLIVGLDTTAGVGGIGVRPMADSDDRSDDLDDFLDRVDGEVGLLERTGTSTGFATHIYADINIFIGIIGLGLEFWTTNSDHEELVPADLRPAVGVHAFRFGGSFDGERGRSVVSLIHGGGAAAGMWALTGDLHGQTIDDGSTITGSSFPTKQYENTGEGDADFEFTFQGAKATVLAEILVIQGVMRNHDFADASGAPSESVNASAELVHDLELTGPDGVMTLIGSGQAIRDLAARST